MYLRTRRSASALAAARSDGLTSGAARALAASNLLEEQQPARRRDIRHEVLAIVDGSAVVGKGEGVARDGPPRPRVQSLEHKREREQARDRLRLDAEDEGQREQQLHRLRVTCSG